MSSASEPEPGKTAENALGSGLKNLASTVRDNAPREGTLGDAAATLADTLERGGDYLDQQNLGKLAQQVEDLIRRHPLPAVLVGVGLGIVLARLTRKES